MNELNIKIIGSKPEDISSETFIFTADALRQRLGAELEARLNEAKQWITPPSEIVLKLDAETLARHIEMHLVNFPTRHQENLFHAVAAKHQKWSKAFDDVYARLGSGKIFVLLGERGTGKTQFATALARRLVETRTVIERKGPNHERKAANHNARFAEYTVLANLFTEIKATFKDNCAHSEQSILDMLSDAELLVLDESHEVSGTDWQMRIFTLLVDSRYANNVDTILITNHTERDFLRAVGPSIADRLKECGVFVPFNWPSFRGQR